LHLAERRPRQRVDALPRTALGKVQKHLLPPWQREHAERA